MSNFKRRHSGPNLSPGMMWIMGLCATAYIVYKILAYTYRVNTSSNYEPKMIDAIKLPQIIVEDSTEKIDSVR